MRPSEKVASLVGQLVWQEVVPGAPRTGFQAHHAQARACQDGRHHAAHSPHPHQDHVCKSTRRLDAFLRIVAGYIEGFARATSERVAHVLERLDLATLGHGFLGEVLLGGVFEPDPRMAQKLPAQLVSVRSMGRIGEEPLLQVGS
jgi:hypothetical protein